MKRVKRSKKASDRVLRHLPELSDFPLPEVPLKFREVPTIGLDGVAGKATFDAYMIEIALDQRIGIHARRMIANRFREDNATRDASNLDTLRGFRY